MNILVISAPYWQFSFSAHISRTVFDVRKTPTCQINDKKFHRLSKKPLISKPVLCRLEFSGSFLPWIINGIWSGGRIWGCGPIGVCEKRRNRELMCNIDYS